MYFSHSSLFINVVKTKSFVNILDVDGAGIKYVSIFLPLSSLKSVEYPGILGITLPIRSAIVVPICISPKLCIYPKSSSITFKFALYFLSLYGS